jgi:hypothetical protein
MNFIKRKADSVFASKNLQKFFTFPNIDRRFLDKFGYFWLNLINKYRNQGLCSEASESI